MRSLEPNPQHKRNNRRLAALVIGGFVVVVTVVLIWSSFEQRGIPTTSTSQSAQDPNSLQNQPHSLAPRPAPPEGSATNPVATEP